MERASFEDELAKESIHLRIKIIRPAEPGEDEGYNNEDDEDDVKANTNNISNNDRARLADRNSSNTGWMAAPDWLVIDHNLTGSSHSLLNQPTNTLREKPLRMTNLTDWDSTLPQKLWVQPSDLHLIPKQIRFSTLPCPITRGRAADGLAVICFGRPNTWSINLTMVLIKHP
ncbi:hypothetical protein PPACK8108_LOCUS1498 [Phakopsora pachyrhizi]|uniref:Uncharacterized protein n=1 Tax=Phakopsora pachyrhizi TaxID=170000 RepID=A0AAV0AH93_PHAPC|nr:hypothetical protein PPACK8108_LOCUS1498 [Phakopsora pachyrhizi]